VGENTGARFLAFVDSDVDGFGAEGTATLVCPLQIGVGYSRTSGDCNDADAAIFPGQPDDDCDGSDNDCDGSIDEDGFRFRDLDGDGYGDANAFECADADSPLYADRAGDCFDTNANAFPGQTAFFAVHRGDDSFDYNCNDSEELRYAQPGRCSSAPFCWWTEEQGGGALPGFYPTQVACGGNGNILVRCDLQGNGTCANVLQSNQRQTCR
jgi:hypothetical protein